MAGSEADAENDGQPLLNPNRHDSEEKERTNSKTAVALTLLIMSLCALGATGYVTYFFVTKESRHDDVTCTVNTSIGSNCTISLVESIPENLTYPAGSPRHPTTFETWMKLLQAANKTVDIASMYWTLRGEDSGYAHPTDWQGEAVFREINVTRQRGVRVRIVQASSTGTFGDNETRLLQSWGVDVRQLDMQRLLGGGILHTKLWIVDGKHFLSGSANTDWRSLTQVKELCQVTWDCPCATVDVQKIFDVYWQMAATGSTIPTKFAFDLHTQYNEEKRMQLLVNGVPATAYLGSSPPQFCPSGRTDSLTSILKTIGAAEKSVSIAVMDYFPTTLYSWPRTYWADIDDALRRAAFDRGVHVRVMGSLWEHTRSDMHSYLLSLASLDGIHASEHNVSVEVRLFEVNATADQAKIPFARVNHNKYMVTDNAAYIGTSNWSKDYFTDTCGVDYVLNQTAAIQSGTPVEETIQGQLQAVFDRDWNSPYAKKVVKDPASPDW